MGIKNESGDLPREIRKTDEEDHKLYKFLSGGAEWDDSVKNETYADVAFQTAERLLRDHGVELTKKIQVLEIGSGNAVFLDHLRSKGINAVGVDVRPRGNNTSPQAVARIEQLPFADEAFDVVISNNVFDQLAYNHDQPRMLKEIFRVLKKQGIYLGIVEKISPVPIENFDNISQPGDLNAVYKKI